MSRVESSCTNHWIKSDKLAAKSIIKAVTELVSCLCDSMCDITIIYIYVYYIILLLRYIKYIKNDLTAT